MGCRGQCAQGGCYEQHPDRRDFGAAADLSYIAAHIAVSLRIAAHPIVLTRYFTH
jgi:hypothetical protein